MNFRERLKMHRLELMRRRARQPCNCAACQGARQQMGNPLVAVLQRLGASVEPGDVDDQPGGGSKAH